MQRVQYHRYGGPQALRLEDVATPEPGPGQVRVRVMAAAANPMDWVIRAGKVWFMSGRRFPRGLGHDFAGVVEAVGPGVNRLKVGDEVFGATALREAGAFAEAVVADEKTTVLKPPSLSFAQAAALPIVAVTAWTALIDKARLQPGQSVFIAGCLGGVGRAAVQIARARGAQVAGSCAASGREEALALGVDEVADYRGFDAAAWRGRFDVVFDTAGGLSLGQCATLLKRGGVALHIVNTPRKMIASLLSARHISVYGDATPQCLAGIVAAAEQGQLNPKIGRTVSLTDAIPAIVELEKTGLPKGKLIVVPAERP
jgi:NADPH:quinone reductase-like Zn-dependent oxidoreductase